MDQMGRETATAINQAYEFSRSQSEECAKTFLHCLVTSLSWGANSHHHTIGADVVTDDQAKERPPDFTSYHYRTKDDERPFVMGMIYHQHSKTWSLHS